MVIRGTWMHDLLYSDAPYWVSERAAAKRLLDDPAEQQALAEWLAHEQSPEGRVSAYRHCLDLPRDPFN